MSERDKLIAVDLDEGSLAAASANAEHERRIAMFDLLESNSFAVEGQDRGPYKLRLSTEDGRLNMAVRDEADADVFTHPLSLAPFRRLIKDYFMICESYYAAIRDATPMQIEAIDMGRRGLHNEGAETLTKALAGKFAVDFETSRRLFTLICALHVRN
ncbi:MAG TPA: UPF0262 family protein [Caulobacterales bacterium]|nr:UPF0262 family protein [Caulobacterales bacterium]